jgi:hypothetical protein
MRYCRGAYGVYRRGHARGACANIVIPQAPWKISIGKFSPLCLPCYLTKTSRSSLVFALPTIVTGVASIPIDVAVSTSAHPGGALRLQHAQRVGTCRAQKPKIFQPIRGGQGGTKKLKGVPPIATRPHRTRGPPGGGEPAKEFSHCLCVYGGWVGGWVVGGWVDLHG